MGRLFTQTRGLIPSAGCPRQGQLLLRDNFNVPRQRVVVPRRHFGKCSRTNQQGISPGWKDLYKADLSGQWLRLRQRRLRSALPGPRADPLRRLVETEETDSATSVAFRVDGNRVGRANSGGCR
jgi:hypothetical protein